MLIWTISAK